MRNVGLATGTRSSISAGAVREVFGGTRAVKGLVEAAPFLARTSLGDGSAASSRGRLVANSL